MVAVAVVVFAKGWVEGVTGSVSESFTHYHTGHIRVIDREYGPRERLLTLIHPVDGLEGEGALKMAASLEGVEGVELAVPRLRFGAMATTDDELVSMTGWGVIPEKELEFTRIGGMITEGRMIREGEREIIAGQALLKDLGIGVGDSVTVVYNTSFGSIGGTTFRVAGKVRSSLRLLNERVFMLPLGVAQELLHMEGQATDILLDVSSVTRAERVLPGVMGLIESRGASGRYEAIPWYNSGAMAESIFIMRYIYTFIYIFILALASFVLINTMIMVVSERKKEIGMMGALGMDRRGILGVFAAEGLMKGVAGSFAGALLGGGLTAAASSAGIDLGEALAALDEGVLINTVIHPVFSVRNMVFAFLLGVVIVGVACYLPARKAADLRPTEALRDK